MLVAMLAKMFGGQIIGAIADAYKSKVEAGVSHDKLTADMVVRELEVQQREIEAQKEIRLAQVGRWYTPENLFCYIVVIYFAKIVVWDKVLGSFTDGTTDPLTGSSAEWAAMIVMFLFGKRGAENIARILARR